MNKEEFFKRDITEIQTDKDIKIEIPNETIIGCDILPVFFINSPFLIYTEKATYTLIVNNGIDLSTGNKIAGNNTLYKLFDFSLNHPIYQHSYAIIKDHSTEVFSEKINKDIALSIGFRLLSDLSSIYKIHNYILTEFNTLRNEICSNSQKYANIPINNILPQIPFLKENIDAFFNCATNIISHYLTFFDLKYKNGSIDIENPSLYKCIEFIKQREIKDKEELLTILNSIKDTENHLRNIRNCLYHPENHLFNVFLYNIYFNKNNQILPPILEFIYKGRVQNINIIEYIEIFFNEILIFSKKYLSFMANH